MKKYYIIKFNSTLVKLKKIAENPKWSSSTAVDVTLGELIPS